MAPDRRPWDQIQHTDRELEDAYEIERALRLAQSMNVLKEKSWWGELAEAVANHVRSGENREHPSDSGHPRITGLRVREDCHRIASESPSRLDGCSRLPRRHFGTE